MAKRHELHLFQLGDGQLETDPYRRVQCFGFQPRHRYSLGFYFNDLLEYADLRELDRVGRQAAAAIDAGGFDLALVSSCRWSYAPPVLRHLRTPSLYFCHEPPFRRFYEPMCRVEAAPLSRYERARALWQRPTRVLLDEAVRYQDYEHARSASMLVANSRFTAQRIAAVYGRQAEVCYLGVDAARFSPPLEACRERRVISVGALEAHKGFDFVIRALGHIRAGQRPSLTVAGATGHPRMAGHLRHLAQEVGVELDQRTGIGAEGQGVDEDLAFLYGTHSLFVFGSHFEPYGLVLLEAMACGLPIVCVAEGGLPEIVEHATTGLLAPRDEQAFAKAVTWLLNHEERRGAMGRAARERALRTTWEGATRRLEECMRAVAGLPGPVPALAEAR